MFKYNDKISLTLINAKDIEGNILPLVIKLPLDKEYVLPSELVSIDVFEYHEGTDTVGNIVFSIYVGKSATTKEIISDLKNQSISISPTLEIPSINSIVCYQEIFGIKEIFAVLNEQDIVVENEKQLISIIKQLSEKFNNLHSCINKIRTLKNNKK